MQHITQLIEQYGLFVVFLNVLLDRSGLPLPSWPALLVAGALSTAGGASLAAVLLAAVAGSLIADLAWFMTAARLGRRVLVLLCKVSLSPDSCVRQTESLFGRFGPAALLFAKFVPGLGYVTVALSGITGVNLPLFLLLDAVGAAVYFTVPIVLGRLFRNAIDAVMATLVQLGEYGVAIVIAGFVAYLALRWIERQAFVRRLRMDRISVDELAKLIDSGKTPVIFDVRASDARLRDGIIPGAVAAHHTDIEAVLRQYPRDVEVVIYCACPNEATAATAARHLKRAGYRKIRPLLGGIDAWTQAGRPVEMPG
ncbi:MAG TPA: DedA family protein/thiosulfate sulfurtransferase GlpE [Rhizomicrobium sp.]|jgi:membrane protein DedA with SNARE-associated domain/rhodanese-related sulfurtransferase|nr:DedA family protein/thiosulfate sulfurtransferase GlpE [Rhizomicrobium sp.]